MAEHEHGSMDTRNQEATFAGFVRLAGWGAGVAILVLIIMALTNA